MRRLSALAFFIIFSIFGLATTLEVLESASYSGIYGMKVRLAGTDSSYVQNNSPTAETRYRARFYLRLNDVTIPEGEAIELFSGFNSSDTRQFIVKIIKSGTYFYLQSSVLVNSGSYVETVLGQSPVLTGGWHAIEIDWQVDVSAGYLKIWFDGLLTTGISDVDNHQGVLDYVQLGALDGAPTGSSGSYDLDLFESRRLSYIGLECHSQQELKTAIHAWRPTYTITDLVQWLNAACP